MDIKDIEEKYQIDFKSLDIKIFLNSTLLTGSNELPNNPFYFGELDQDLEYKDLISNTLKEQKTTQVDKKQAIAKLHAF